VINQSGGKENMPFGFTTVLGIIVLTALSVLLFCSITSDRRDDLWLIQGSLVFILIAVALIVLWDGRFLFSENIGVFDWKKDIYYFHFLHSSIAEFGEIPLSFLMLPENINWYPTLKQTSSYWANPEVMTFSPLFLLIPFLSTIEFIKTYFFIHLLVGALGVFWLSHRLGFGIFEALLLLPFTILNPWLMQHLAIGYTPWIHACFIPMIVALLIGRNRQIIGLVVASSLNALILYGGALHIFIWFNGAVGLFCLIYVLRRRQIWFLAKAIPFFLLTSLLIFPKVVAIFSVFNGWERNIAGSYSSLQDLWGLWTDAGEALYNTPRSYDIYGVNLYDGSVFMGKWFLWLLALSVLLSIYRFVKIGWHSEKSPQFPSFELAIVALVFVLLGWDGVWKRLVVGIPLLQTEVYPWRFSFVALFSVPMFMIWEFRTRFSFLRFPMGRQILMMGLFLPVVFVSYSRNQLFVNVAISSPDPLVGYSLREQMDAHITPTAPASWESTPNRIMIYPGEDQQITLAWLDKQYLDEFKLRNAEIEDGVETADSNTSNNGAILRFRDEAKPIVIQPEDYDLPILLACSLFLYAALVYGMWYQQKDRFRFGGHRKKQQAGSERREGGQEVSSEHPPNRSTPVTTSREQLTMNITRWIIAVGLGLVTVSYIPRLIASVFVNLGYQQVAIAGVDMLPGGDFSTVEIDRSSTPPRVNQAESYFHNALLFDTASIPGRRGLGHLFLTEGQAELAAQTFQPIEGSIDSNPLLFLDILRAYNSAKWEGSALRLGESNAWRNLPFFLLCRQGFNDSIRSAYKEYATSHNKSLQRTAVGLAASLQEDYSCLRWAQEESDVILVGLYQKRIWDFDIDLLAPTLGHMANANLDVIPDLVDEGLWNRAQAVNVLSWLVGQHYSADNLENLLDTLQERNPSDPLWLLYLGEFYHRRGELFQAEAIYRQALAITPDNPELLLRLGLVSEALASAKDTLDLEWMRQASNWFERYHDVAPDDLLSIRKLSEMYSLLNKSGAKESLRNRYVRMDTTLVTADLLGVDAEKIRIGGNIISGTFEHWASIHQPIGWQQANHAILGGPWNTGAFIGSEESLLSWEGSSIRIDGLWLQEQSGLEPGRSGFELSKSVELEPQSGYVMTFFYRTKNTSESAASMWISSNAQVLLANDRRLPNTGGQWWRFVAVGRNNTDELAFVRPILRSFSTGQVWFDNIELRPLDIQGVPIERVFTSSVQPVDVTKP